jgi:hypothetical protein
MKHPLCSGKFILSDLNLTNSVQNYAKREMTTGCFIMADNVTYFVLFPKIAVSRVVWDELSSLQLTLGSKQTLHCASEVY